MTYRRTGARGGEVPLSPTAGPSSPELTVVMPVLNGRDFLPRSVGALEASSVPRERWELLAVDDGSRDGSAAWVRDRGHRVLTVRDGPRGPGHARNLGGIHARGRVLAFVDADVCVHEDVLARILATLDEHDDVAAVFGSYDESPADPSFLSQYRNLYHRWVHLRGAGDAETFWAGCGAVRTRIFREVGGFDEERFPRPQIEDIELGYRIRDAGWRIVLDPQIEATHLKRWNLPAMLRTDLQDRGIPWMRLLLAEPRPDALNVDPAERVRTGLVGLALAFLVAGAFTGRAGWVAAAGLALAANVISNAALYRWLAERRGWWFALMAVPFNLLYYGVAGLSVGVAWAGHRFSPSTPRAAPTALPNEADAGDLVSGGDPS
jgi:hypothetical protein